MTRGEFLVCDTWLKKEHSRSSMGHSTSQEPSYLSRGSPGGSLRTSTLPTLVGKSLVTGLTPLKPLLTVTWQQNVILLTSWL